MLRLKYPRRLLVITLGLSFTLITIILGWLSRPAPPLYTIVDLGVLPGASASEAYGLNNRGEVTGTSFGSGLHAHTFLYRAGKMTNIDTPGISGSSMGYAINDKGEITGALWPQHGQGGHAFFYSGGGMRDIGASPAFLGSAGYGLNNQGDVCGRAFALQGALAPHVFFYTGDHALTLSMPPGCTSGIAQGINDQGQIVGKALFGTSQAFLYNSRNKQMTLLNVPPPYTNSAAIKINNQGQIIGAAGFANSAAGFPIGAQHAVLWENDKMTDLGTLPHSTGSVGLGISNREEAVGYCFREFGALEAAWRRLVWKNDEARTWAFVWRHGRMTDLNEMLPANSGWILEEARGINDRGQIAGYGLHHGQERAFLLTPVH